MDDFEKYHRKINGLSENGMGDTWRLMKMTASKDELAELKRVELRAIKSGQHYINQNNQYENEYGQIITVGEAMAERRRIRKKAEKFFNNPEKLNNFIRNKLRDE